MEPVKATKTTVLDTILAPLRALLREQCTQLKDDADNYKLSLAPFVLNLVFAVLNNIKSISLLITEIDSSAVAREIGLIKASKSMYSEAFEFLKHPRTATTGVSGLRGRIAHSRYSNNVLGHLQRVSQCAENPFGA
jgi:hypothetical protein